MPQLLLSAACSTSAAGLLHRPQPRSAAVSRLQRHRHQTYWRAHGTDEDGPSTSAAAPEAGPAAGTPAVASDDGDSLFEQQVLAKKRKPKAKQQQQQEQQGPRVISAARDRVYGGGPLTFEQQAENTVVVVLGVLFSVIVLEGLFLAGSGFLSDAADQFALDVVYPAFSPTLGLFLAISTLYGLWKTGGGRSADSPDK